LVLSALSLFHPAIKNLLARSLLSMWSFWGLYFLTTLMFFKSLIHYINYQKFFKNIKEIKICQDISSGYNQKKKKKERSTSCKSHFSRWKRLILLQIQQFSLVKETHVSLEGNPSVLEAETKSILFLCFN
jgi:hypothetical protein